MTKQENLSEVSLIELMLDVLKVSEEIVIKNHSGNLRLKRKKYTQLRLMGIAHALFRDMASIGEHGSARTLELLI